MRTYAGGGHQKPLKCRDNSYRSPVRRIERPVTQKQLICRAKRGGNYNDMHLMRQLSNPGPEVRSLDQYRPDDGSRN
jgi:hypothetical protein